jgi:hypothetical protein
MALDPLGFQCISAQKLANHRLSKVVCARWDPCFDEFLGLCDEAGVFKYVNVNEPPLSTSQNLFSSTVNNVDAHGHIVKELINDPWLKFEFLKEYPGQLVFAFQESSQVFQTHVRSTAGSF